MVQKNTLLTIKFFEEPIDQAEKVTIKADIVHNSNFARVNGESACYYAVDEPSTFLL